MTSVDTTIDEEGYSVNALIFLLIGVFILLLIYIIAIYLMVKFWSQIDQVWKISSAIFMVLLSPLMSIIFVLLGVISSLQKANL
jgi:predicted neutral ceramidase superfamily lipid hydrolase